MEMGKGIKDKLLWLQDRYIQIYVGILAFGFPLCIHDRYKDITITKFRFVVWTTIICMLVFLFLRVYNWSKHRMTLSIKRRKWDSLYLGFLAVSTVSVLLSQYPKEAFWGSAGRWIGLFIYLIYGLMLVMILSDGKVSMSCMYLLEASTVLTGGLALLNHYNIDPLGAYVGLRQYQQNAYISTIGNIDFFAVYIGLMFVVSAVLFMKSNSTKEWIGYGIPMLIAAAGIACGGADTGFISVIVFMIAGWIFAASRQELLRYFIAFTSFLGISKLIGYWDAILESEKELGGLANRFTRSDHLLMLFLFGMIICIAFGIIVIEDWGNASVDAAIRKCMLILLGMCMIVSLCVFLWANLKGEMIPDDSILQYIRITDEWGALRGYTYRKTLEYFKRLPVMEMLFGIGPDLALFTYRDILVDEVFTQAGFMQNNAHNEYLQILLTHGILGTVTYFGWAAASIIQCLKKAKQNKIFAAIGFGLISYAVAMAVGVNTINVTAIAFLLLCLGKCELIEKNGRNK